MWLEKDAKNHRQRRLEKVDQAIIAVNAYIRLMLLELVSESAADRAISSIREYIFHTL